MLLPAHSKLRCTMYLLDIVIYIDKVEVLFRFLSILGNHLITWFPYTECCILEDAMLFIWLILSGFLSLMAYTIPRPRLQISAKSVKHYHGLQNLDKVGQALATPATHCQPLKEYPFHMCKPLRAIVNPCINP